MGSISTFVYVETPVVDGIYQYRVHCGPYGCLYQGTSWDEAVKIIQGCIDEGLAGGCCFDGIHELVGEPGLDEGRPQCGELTNIKPYLTGNDDPGVD
jgi:hypothetical protein